jgi:hypothetical protein
MFTRGLDEKLSGIGGGLKYLFYLLNDLIS